LTRKVSAVVSAGAPYDDEVISSLQDAQSLRGIGQGQATFLRLKVDPSAFNMTLLLQTVRGKGAGGSEVNPFLQQLQLAPTTYLVSIIPRGSSTPSLTTALGGGLRLVQTVFQSLGVVVLLASVLALYFATSYWLYGTKPTQETLSALGMGTGRLRAWLLAVTVPISVLAGLLGYLVAYWGISSLSATGGIEFFFQPLTVPLDPESIVVSCVGPAVAVAAAVVSGTSRLAPRRPRRS
jgi:ABC-type antimicrobial peptide transport system permease subunit